jgi:hypothetical protein
MNILTFRIKRSPGFRLNLTDLILIGILIGLSVFIHGITTDYYYYLLPIYLGVTFFLFCNIFRVGNRVEPWWYITFLIITVTTVHEPELYWPLMLGICVPLQVLLIIYRIWRGPYLGVGYQWVGKYDPAKIPDESGA